MQQLLPSAWVWAGACSPCRRIERSCWCKTWRGGWGDGPSLELGCSFRWTSGWKGNWVRQNTQSLNFSLVFWGSHSLAGKELVAWTSLGPGGEQWGNWGREAGWCVRPQQMDRAKCPPSPALLFPRCGIQRQGKEPCSCPDSVNLHQQIMLLYPHETSNICFSLLPASCPASPLLH